MSQTQAAKAAPPTPVADKEPEAPEIPFGSPAQKAGEAKALAAAKAAQPTFLPSRRPSGAKPVPPFGELTLLLFGKPGVGKTRLAGSNPGAYFLSLEPGQNFVDAPVIEIKNWRGFQQHVQAMHEQRKKTGKVEFTTAVIDIVDILSAYCLDHVCARKGLRYPPTDDFGKTWKEINQEWQAWLRSLMQVVNVVFITHSTEGKAELTLDNGTKEEKTVQQPTFNSGKPAQYLAGIVNAVGHVFIKANGKHAVTFAKTAGIDAKDRTDILSRMGEFELHEDAQQSWQKISSAYEAKAKERGCVIKSVWHNGERQGDANEGAPTA